MLQARIVCNVARPLVRRRALRQTAVVNQLGTATSLLLTHLEGTDASPTLGLGILRYLVPKHPIHCRGMN